MKKNIAVLSLLFSTSLFSMDKSPSKQIPTSKEKKQSHKLPLPHGDYMRNNGQPSKPQITPSKYQWKNFTL